MKQFLPKIILVLLIMVSSLIASSVNATITGGYISLDASSPLTNAHGCYWENMNVYNNQLPTGGSGQFAFYWEENQGSGWVVKSYTPGGTANDVGQVYVQQYASTRMRRRAVDWNNPNDSAYSNEVTVASFWVQPGSIKFASGNTVEYSALNVLPPMILNEQYENCENPPNFYQFMYRVGANGRRQFDPEVNPDPNNAFCQPMARSTPDTVTYWRIPYDGSCGPYPDDPTNGLVIIFQNSIAFNPGVISSNVSQACSGTTIRLNSTATTAPVPYSIQWQISSDSITWMNAGTTDSISYTITSTKFFKRSVTAQNSIYFSNIIKVALATPGDSSLFGTNYWNVHSYIGKSSSLVNVTYKGSYTDSSLDINTVNKWAANLSPSSASNFQGCPVYVNNFTIDLRRKGFDTGLYQLQIPVYNEEIKIKKDGVTVFSGLCCNTNPPNINLGILGANTKLQVTHVAGTSNIPLQAHFLKIDTANTTSYVDSLCHSINVGAPSGNSFISLVDTFGQVIAAVNPNGVNMGTLTVNMKHSAPGATNVPVSNIGVVNMPRYFNFKASNFAAAPFPNPVTVRLYYLNSEFDDYKIATNQPFLTIADLAVSHYDGVNQDCESYNNSTVIDTLPLTGWGYVGANTFYIDVQTNRFSEFGVSGQLNILPVKWLSANAKRQNQKMEVTWKVAWELNNSSFEVLRSSDGLSFKTIAMIASKGNSSQPVEYSFNDEKIVQTVPYVYYRIKQTDNDRRFSLSNVMKVKMTDNDIVTLLPNPSIDFTVTTSSGIISSYSIADLSGKVIQNKIVGANTSHISTNALSEGIYILKVLLADGSTKTLKLVRQ